MEALQSNLSSQLAWQVRSQDNLIKIKDPVSGEQMTRAVTAFPCGHAFNEDTVIRLLARDKLCPLDERRIERSVPNYCVRYHAENPNSLPTEKDLTPEAEAYFIQGKKHADAGDDEQAVEAFLQVLKLCPQCEEAQAALESCLDKRLQSHSLADIGTQPGLPKIAFGKAEWEMYFGNIGDEPPLPSNIQEILDSPCPFTPGRKVSDTHSLVLIPDMINSEPFNLNALEELIKTPKTGYKASYGYYIEEVKHDLGSTSQHSHWILMTTDLIPNSRGIMSVDIDNFVQEHARFSKTPYKLPTFLEAATMILVEHARHGIRFYSDEPTAYTFCREMVNVNKTDWPAVLGDFSQNGLVITRLSYYNDPFLTKNLGVGLLREF